MEFIKEVEKLKLIFRQNVVIDGSRQENSAEHSWHIALMAIVLSEYSDSKEIDLLRVLKMLLIHDIVEIDTGDTFLYDCEANKTKGEKEYATANRVFGLLPEITKREFMSLWQEFEKRETADARFAAALDGLQPLMNHLLSKGQGIIKHKLKTDQIIAKKKFIEDTSKELWEFAKRVIQESENAGLYTKGD
ncbi:Metal dependent phosphohydrolase [Chitinispirillum alkaliphilum]|nr:Metal dependent phosphohydrolase [Chitinispirillum alkaliphilum]